MIIFFIDSTKNFNKSQNKFSREKGSYYTEKSNKIYSTYRGFIKLCSIVFATRRNRLRFFFFLRSMLVKFDQFLI